MAWMTSLTFWPRDEVVKRTIYVAACRGQQGVATLGRNVGLRPAGENSVANGGG